MLVLSVDLSFSYPDTLSRSVISSDPLFLSVIMYAQLRHWNLGLIKNEPFVNVFLILTRIYATDKMKESVWIRHFPD